MQTAPRLEIARMSAELVSPLAEAQEMAHDGKLDADFAQLMQHVRDMYDLFAAALDAAGDAIPPEARAVAAQRRD